MSDNETLLTLADVARIARAPVSSVRHWISDGRLRSVRPGRRRMVRRADLESFLSTERPAPSRPRLLSSPRPFARADESEHRCVDPARERDGYKSLVTRVQETPEIWVLQLVASFGTIIRVIRFCPWCGAKLATSAVEDA